MSLFAIGDPHLSFSCDKPMDIFRGWDDYVSRLMKNWNSVVTENDTVVVPGDISWATYIERAEEDFRFIDELPGIKLISKGNHDYWWETLSKLNKYIDKMKFSSLHFMHNSIYKHENIVVCAAKGYPDNGTTAEDIKLYNREVSRLQLSLDMAAKEGAEQIFVCFITHRCPARNLPV